MDDFSYVIWLCKEKKESLELSYDHEDKTPLQYLVTFTLLNYIPLKNFIL